MKDGAHCEVVHTLYEKLTLSPQRKWGAFVVVSAAVAVDIVKHIFGHYTVVEIISCTDNS